MKQHHVKSEKKIGENTFYIRPFPAFTAINISGELLTSLGSTFVGLAPLAMQDGETNVFNLNASSLSGAFSSLSGDKLESLLKKLLTKHGNISVELGNDGVKLLDDDFANEVFCGEAQDMFILAAEVINVNFPLISKKFKDLFGSQKEDMSEEKTNRSKNTDG